MQQLDKYKEPARRVFLLAFGLALIAYAVHGIHCGHITYGRASAYAPTHYADTEPGKFWFGVCIYFFLGGVFVYLGAARPGARKSSGNKHKAARKEALRLGMTVSDVERNLPEFSRGNRSCRLVPGSSARYALPRHGEGARAVWSLLQRTQHEGAQLPNGYLLEGNVSDPLREALTKLAAEFSEDYFEFEGTTTDVAVYWEEWGGASQVRHMHQVLQGLAGL